MTTTIEQSSAERSSATRAADREAAIDLTLVDKTYRGKVRALREVSMRVMPGEVFGLLGANGAGKSTLVKILMTVVRADRCSGSLLGQPIGHKPTLARVGYLPEHHDFPDYLTGRQALDFYGAMAKTPRRQRRKRIDELLDLVGMSEWAGRRMKSYSKGMRQRIGVAQSLVNDPDLVLLDEPTDGVDPVGRRDIRNILLRLKEQDKTVFLNSHLLSELEMVCDRVAILVQGVVAQQGTLDELTSDRRRYEVELAEASDMAAGAAAAKQGFGAGEVSEDAARRVITLATTDAARVQPVIDAVRAAGITIAAVRPVRPSLEDLFMQTVTDPVTGETLRPGADISRGAKS
ncbi:MAG: ATP-binding cassette domain-containing protein [Phycisphaerales bacterium JB039]